MYVCLACFRITLVCTSVVACTSVLHRVDFKAFPVAISNNGCYGTVQVIMYQLRFCAKSN